MPRKVKILWTWTENCKLSFFRILPRLTAKFSCSNPGQFLKGILWSSLLGLPVGTDTETWPWEGFSLQAGRFSPAHGNPMCFSLGFITRETGFMKCRQLSCFGALGRVFSTVEGSPSTRGGSYNPSSPRPGGQDLFCSQRILLQSFFTPGYCSLGSRPGNSAYMELKAGSMFWSLEKNSFFSPVDRLQSSNLLGIRHYLCLKTTF